MKKRYVSRILAVVLAISLSFGSFGLDVLAAENEVREELTEELTEKFNEDDDSSDLADEAGIDDDLSSDSASEEAGFEDDVVESDEFIDEDEQDGEFEEDDEKDSDETDPFSDIEIEEIADETDAELMGLTYEEYVVQDIINYVVANYDSKSGDNYTIRYTDEKGIVHSINTAPDPDNIVFYSELKSRDYTYYSRMYYNVKTLKTSSIDFDILAATAPVMSVGARAALDQENYRYGDILDFRVTSGVNFNSLVYDLQYVANMYSTVCIGGWNKLLYDRCNYTLYSLGFTSIVDKSDDNINDLKRDDSIEHFSAVQEGEQSIINGSTTSPLSAWKRTNVEYESSDKATQVNCDIRLEDVYIGNEAWEIVKEEDSTAAIPVDEQQWFVFRYYVKNNSDRDLDVNSIFSESHYCNEHSQSITPVSYASFNGERKDIQLSTKVLAPGESSYVWEGALFNGNVFRLINIQKGFDNRRKAEYAILSTNPYYVRETYRVYFDPQGGTVNDVYKELGYGDLYGTLPVPSREGRRFKGWSITQNSEDIITEESEFKQLSDQTLYAIWNDTTRTDIEDNDYYNCVREGVQAGVTGTYQNPQSLWQKTTYDKIAIRLDELYIGEKAYEIIKRENQYNIEPSETRHWLLFKFYVENNGTTTADVSKIVSGARLFDRNGEHISNHSIAVFSKDLKSVGYSNVKVSPGKSSEAWIGLLIDKKYGFPYYRVIESSRYGSIWFDMDPYYGILNATFDPQGGEISMTEKTVYLNSQYGTLPTPIKEGYTFVGWSLDKDNKRTVTSSTKVSTKTDHTLYAFWETKKVNISFDYNAGTGDKENIIAEYKSWNNKFPTATRLGYEFLGWFDQKEGGNEFPESTIIDSEEDFTLYAHWKAKNYTVSLNYNDGSDRTNTFSVTYDSAYDQLPESAEKDGYTFTGWFTKADNGDNIKNGDIVSIADDHTLYAHWTPNTYTVTLDANGGAVYEDSIQVVFNSEYGTLPGPSFDDMVFMGWYTEPEGGTRIVSSTVVNTPGDHTIYAQWRQPGATAVRLNYNNLTIGVGEKKQLTAIVMPLDYLQDVKWESSDTNTVTVTDGNLTAVSFGRATITATSMDNRAKAVCEVIVAESDMVVDEGFEVPNGLWVKGLDEGYSYTGKKITPEFEVYYGSTLLRKGSEYTVAFKNNINAGNAIATITGKGNFSGNCTATFKILPQTLNYSDVDIVSKNENGGNEVKPTVIVIHDGVTLKVNKDYTFTHNPIRAEGSTTVYVTGKGNYIGTVSGTFYVESYYTTTLDSLYVEGVKKSYTLSEIEELKNDHWSIFLRTRHRVIDRRHYVVNFDNCDRVGKGTIVIKPSETRWYSGEKRIPVTITGKKLGSVVLQGNLTYTGYEQKPQVRVYSGSKGSGSLIPESAYTVTYSSGSVNAGTVTVTVTANPTEGYSGKLTAKYKIYQRAITDRNVNILLPDTVYYTKNGTAPTIMVNYTSGDRIWTLREGVDYNVSFANNNAVNGAKIPTITVTGMGNFTGKISKSFKISKQDINSLQITCADIQYNAKKMGAYFYSKPVIYDNNGKLLKEKTDYTVTYSILDTGANIGKRDYVNNNTTICAHIVASEVNYTGTVDVTYKVIGQAKNISSAKTGKISDRYYTGKPVELDSLSVYYPTVVAGRKTDKLLQEGTDYVVTGYYNNIKKGTASLRIEGRGEYSGSKTITFKIVTAKNNALWKGIYIGGKLVN